MSTRFVDPDRLWLTAMLLNINSVDIKVNIYMYLEKKSNYRVTVKWREWPERFRHLYGTFKIWFGFVSGIGLVLASQWFPSFDRTMVPYHKRKSHIFSKQCFCNWCQRKNVFAVLLCIQYIKEKSLCTLHCTLMHTCTFRELSSLKNQQNCCQNHWDWVCVEHKSFISIGTVRTPF